MGQYGSTFQIYLFWNQTLSRQSSKAPPKRQKMIFLGLTSIIHTRPEADLNKLWTSTRKPLDLIIFSCGPHCCSRSREGCAGEMYGYAGKQNRNRR
jgi:hypothetical protein